MNTDTVEFRLLHISDLHLCVEPKRRNAEILHKRRPRDFIDALVTLAKQPGYGSWMKPQSFAPEALSAVAAWCHERTETADVIIVSGDLATTGLASDMAVAKSFVAAPASEGFVSADGSPTLASSGLPVYIMPGNHDGYRNNFADPGSKTFELMFADQLKRINYKGGVGHKVLSKGEKYLSLICIDFNLRRRTDCKNPLVGPYGQGKVYQDVLDEAILRTRSLRQKYSGTDVCWIVHYAPFECGNYLELTDWSTLMDAAKNHRIRTILCGHTHEPSRFDTGAVRTYCAGSGASIDREQQHAVHEITISFDGSWSTKRSNFNWSEADAEFVGGSRD